MKVAIHQPEYFPWGAYIHKVMSADIFVYLDNVQFEKNGWQNRNRIKTDKGTCWLTVPVRHKLGTAIDQREIADMDFLSRHFKTIQTYYAKSPGFKKYGQLLEILLSGSVMFLDTIAISSTEWLFDRLGVKTERLKASELKAEGHGSKLITSICKELGATDYLSGPGGLDYMERHHFQNIDCRVHIQEWTSPVYAQQHPQAGFVPDLSTLDIVLNCPDDAFGLIKESGTWRLIWS